MFARSLRCAEDAVRKVAEEGLVRKFTMPYKEPTLFLGEMMDLALHQNPTIRRRAQEYFRGTAHYIPPAALDYELPAKGRPEIAFVGRSNVGKSSVIGAVVGDPSVVRTSKTPGSTTMVNFFAVGKRTQKVAKEPRHATKQSRHQFLRKRADGAAMFLVDCPGYGYARRSKEARGEWEGALAGYLTQRNRAILRHVVLVIDAKRGWYESPDGEGDDPSAFHALSAMVLAHHVVINKMDQAHPLELLRTVEETFQIIEANAKGSTCIPLVHCVSAKTGAGIQELRDNLAQYASNYEPKKGEAQPFLRPILPLDERVPQSALEEGSPYGDDDPNYIDPGQIDQPRLLGWQGGGNDEGDYDDADDDDHDDGRSPYGDDANLKEDPPM